MQDVDSEGAWYHFDRFFDDDYLADMPFFYTADQEAASCGQHPQTPVTEAVGLDAPSSSLLGGMELSQTQYEQCLATLLEAFPGISSEYVRELYNARMQGSQVPPHIHQVRHAFQDMTHQILDAKSYPKEKDRTSELKRKRPQALDSEEEDKIRWKTGRKGQKSDFYLQAVYVPFSFIVTGC